MRDRRRPRQSLQAGDARLKAEAGATGGGLLAWVRKHILGSIIGAALVACLVAWFRGVFDSALADIAPSGADTYCALKEAVTNNWPFADPTAVSDRFTILIATIDQDDANHTYTRAVARAFLNRNGVERIETCRVLRLSSVGREAGIKAVNTARAWLRQRHADLLIGGELLKKDEAVNLWFIGDSSAQSFQATPFRLDANLLKEDFKQAASTQILGVALAAVKAVTEESGKYLVGILKPVTERLRHLLDDAAGLSKEQHAQLQYALGLGLFVVGDQSGDKKALDDAAMAFRAALTGYTRASALQWAATQNNLGAVLMRLGEGKSTTEKLKEAVAAFREPLTEWTRERGPLDWAMSQNNLGIALTSLGERESSTEKLEEAVAAFRKALTEQTRDRVPLDWAATQNNLGIALARLSEGKSGTDRLKAAIAAFRAALTEWTPERGPLQWATAQNNLGLALTSLGERESGTDQLEEAIAAYRAALTERTRERVPYYWAQVQENLTIVFGDLATRIPGDTRRTYLANALASVDGALQVYHEDNASYDIERAERLRALILAEQQQAQAPPR